MPGSFDPYHQWLGISPHDQPANHYRLLGVELFEADSEVVKRAADRQLGYVESVRTNEHAKAAATLLEQLAEARRCLLDLEMKQLYDEGLRDGQKVEWKRSRPATVPTATVPVDRGATTGSTQGTASAAKQKTKPVENRSVR